MKILTYCLAVLITVVSLSIGHAKTLDEYVQEAEKHQEAGRLDKAIATMEQAVKEHPENSTAYFLLGNYIGAHAQRTKGYGGIFRAIEQAFLMWDKALELDSNNFEARFTRGAWSVSVPKFVGRLETGINDLELMVEVLQRAPDVESQAQLANAYYYLGTGYQKKGAVEEAKRAYKKVLDTDPRTTNAERAQENIDAIVLYEKWRSEREKMMKPDSPEIVSLKKQMEKEPNNVNLYTTLGKAYVDAERYEEAEKVLKQAISIDTSNIAAYKMLASVFGEIAMQGYDPRISMDTDFRTDLSFEVIRILDKAVTLAPKDFELRLYRGAAGVEMPFFVGKLDQGIDDLNMVIQSDAPESMKAEALYYLGVAHQKKAMTYWIKVVSEHSDAEASQSVFNRLKPLVKRRDPSKCKPPFVIVDFILGFKDELAPQTAVWVEDKNGKFVKTLYVSGFSGYAKDKQVNLPMWANVSQFVDVDGVTSASIDLGHHIYVWDLKDASGTKVKAGDYIVKVEVSYWPSMQYQRVEAPIIVGKKDEQSIIEEGNLIPYLEINYIH